MTFDVDAYDKNGNIITNLVQWDRDIHVYINLDDEPGDDEVFYMNFFNCSSGVAYVVDATYESGKIHAKIPNVLLQESRPITGYVCSSGMEDERGMLRVRINVRLMPRPSTYILPDSKDYLTILSVLDECVLYAESANLSELNAKQSEENTAVSEQKAIDEASRSDNYAKISESWAVGNTGVRAGENTDNSRYYSDQSRIYKEEIETASNYSKSYAVGGTGTREGEDEDNVKYYYEKSKTLSEYFELATLEEVGTFVGTAYFAFATLEEAESFIGVSVSGG